MSLDYPICRVCSSISSPMRWSFEKIYVYPVICTMVPIWGLVIENTPGTFMHFEGLCYVYVIRTQPPLYSLITVDGGNNSCKKLRIADVTGAKLQSICSNVITHIQARGRWLAHRNPSYLLPKLIAMFDKNRTNWAIWSVQSYNYTIRCPDCFQYLGTYKATYLC